MYITDSIPDLSALISNIKNSIVGSCSSGRALRTYTKIIIIIIIIVIMIMIMIITV